MRGYLVWIAFILYGIFDCVSTIYAYDAAGSFRYEQSMLMKLCFDIGGILFFVFAKLLIAGVCMVALYWLGSVYKHYTPLSESLCIGAALAGLFTGASNIYSGMTGTSIDVLGYGPFAVATGIILGSAVIGGLLALLKKRSTDRAVSGA